MSSAPATQPASKPDRLHAIDALRAAMMLLGVVIHTGNAYKAAPAPLDWPFRDADTSSLFNVLVYVIHSFRMPAFFTIAGLFAVKILGRRGLQAFAGNRSRRVLLPLLLFAIPLFLADELAAHFAETRELSGFAWNLGAFELGHLWFLQYLVVYYLVAAACALALTVPALARIRALLAKASTFIVHPLAPLVLTLPLAACLAEMPFAVLNDSGTPLPRLVPLVTYFMFFLAGAMLAVRSDALDLLRRRAPVTLSTGFVFVFLSLGLLLVASADSYEWATGARTFKPLIAPVSALGTWLLVFGMLGGAMRWLGTPSAWKSYGADASYWVYLSHHALTIFFAAVLGPIRAPAELKFVVAATLTALLCFTSYHFLVRSTWLGVLLNGRRR